PTTPFCSPSTTLFRSDFFRSEHSTQYKKDPRDVVTEADKETERRLIAFILEREPNSQVLGEEGGATGHGDIQWYIDAIDGTGNRSEEHTSELQSREKL